MSVVYQKISVIALGRFLSFLNICNVRKTEVASGHIWSFRNIGVLHNSLNFTLDRNVITYEGIKFKIRL
jgi:hypothetical protein